MSFVRQKYFLGMKLLYKSDCHTIVSQGVFEDLQIESFQLQCDQPILLKFKMTLTLFTYQSLTSEVKLDL